MEELLCWGGILRVWRAGTQRLFPGWRGRSGATGYFKSFAPTPAPIIENVNICDRVAKPGLVLLPAQSLSVRYVSVIGIPADGNRGLDPLLQMLHSGLG